MKLIARFVFHIFSNFIALYAAIHLVSGVLFTGSFLDMAAAAVIFTLINLFIKPVLKLIFGPFIVLTFGLFVIVINAAILYILDIISQPLTIQGYLPLLIASLIIGIINFLISFSGKRTYGK